MLDAGHGRTTLNGFSKTWSHGAVSRSSTADSQNQGNRSENQTLRIQSGHSRRSASVTHFNGADSMRQPIMPHDSQCSPAAEVITPKRRTEESNPPRAMHPTALHRKLVSEAKGGRYAARRCRVNWSCCQKSPEFLKRLRAAMLRRQSRSGRWSMRNCVAWLLQSWLMRSRGRRCRRPPWFMRLIFD